MTKISESLIEKFGLEKTDKHIGQSNFYGATIYRISDLSKNHDVLLANCDQHGLTHENNVLYVFVDGIVNQVEFTKELLESEGGYRIVQEKVHEIIASFGY